MHWIIEESDDCGVRWHNAQVTGRYPCVDIAMRVALVIIEDEWRPPARALQELMSALEHESVAYYWEKGIRLIPLGSDGRG
jgi:hypothetical protein